MLMPMPMPMLTVTLMPTVGQSSSSLSLRRLVVRTYLDGNQNLLDILAFAVERRADRPFSSF
jgi:hypothetical protein